jgi:HPP family
MQAARKQHTAVLRGELLALIYMGVIAFSARKTGFSLLLFPELAALSHDVFTRPRGKWASQPWRLVLTPTITALFGLFVVRHTNFNALALTLIVVVSLLVIKLLKSTIAPAISAGMLSMVLAARSWIYPVGIFGGLSLLALVLLVWKRYAPKNYILSSEEEIDSKVIDDLEAPPHDRLWSAALLVFVLALGTLAQVTGLFFLIFPPLVVVAYEVLGHPEVPGWMARPILFPLISFITAAIGLGFCHVFDASVVGVIVMMVCSITILKIFKVHMPPVLTVGILPFVMKAPNYRYPISVLMGTIALMSYFWAYSSLRESAWLRRFHYKS